MNTQLQKRKLEDLLKRPMSDATWYRLRKQLVLCGCKQDSDFELAFKLISAMNAGKNSTKSRISLIPSGFITIWQAIHKFEGRFKSIPTMTCGELIAYLSAGLEIKPPDRFRDGKYIGINTQWYRWFQECGIPYRKDEHHKLSEYLGVIALAYSWQEKQRIKKVKKIVDEVIDAEILN